MAKGIEVKGEKQLLNMLRELPKAPARRVNRRAVNLATTPILQACRAECPVDEDDLRKSLIKKVTNKDGVADGIVGADANYVSEKGKMPKNYDHLVEYGHATEDGGATTPNPFLARAWDNSIATAKATLETAMGDGIEAEARKLGGG